MTALASILLPTRGRPEQLRASIDSLVQTVSVPSAIEVLVKLDDDDPAAQSFDVSAWPTAVRTIISPRGNGYADLHLMYDQLCKVASGEFLFLWNDDALMLTSGWDDEIRKHSDGKLKFLHAPTDDRCANGFLFPIVHRSWYDKLGYFSASPHNDTYLEQVLMPFYPIVMRETGIRIRHIANDLHAQHDKTHMEARALWPATKRQFGSADMQERIVLDRKRIRGLLIEQGLLT